MLLRLCGAVGAHALLRMRRLPAATPVSRAQRSMKRSGMVRCRPGTLGSAAVPDQRCTASHSARAASHPGHGPPACNPISRCQTAHLVPAAHFCTRGLHPCFTHPERGVGGAPRNVRVRARHPWGLHVTRQARRLARRLASHNAGRSPLGAPPWRFFTRGRASFTGIASGSVERAPRSQVVVPGGRLPGPPGASSCEPPPQDATPRSAFRIVSRRRPSMSEAGKLSSTDTLCSQVL
jgi:hypothetical protein